MSEEERRKEIEKEKSDRQSAQDKELEKGRNEAAAAAIAGVSTGVLGVFCGIFWKVN